MNRFVNTWGIIENIQSGCGDKNNNQYSSGPFSCPTNIVNTKENLQWYKTFKSQFTLPDPG